MPAAIAIPAIASVAGAGISYLGSRSASKAQEKASREAIAFEREREATRKRNFDASMAQYQQRVQYQDALRSALLARLGFSVPSVPSMVTSTPGIYPTPGTPRRLAMPEIVPGQRPGPISPAGSALAHGGTVRDMIVRPGPGELSAWNDWSQHGLA